LVPKTDRHLLSARVIPYLMVQYENGRYPGQWDPDNLVYTGHPFRNYTLDTKGSPLGTAVNVRPTRLISHFPSVPTDSVNSETVSFLSPLIHASEQYLHLPHSSQETTKHSGNSINAPECLVHPCVQNSRQYTVTALGRHTTPYRAGTPQCVHISPASQIVPSMRIIRVRTRSYCTTWSPAGSSTFRVTGWVHTYFRVTPPQQFTHCTVSVAHLYYFATSCTTHLSVVWKIQPS
jgi:hypothetical protein